MYAPPSSNMLDGRMLGGADGVAQGPEMFPPPLPIDGDGALRSNAATEDEDEILWRCEYLP